MTQSIIDGDRIKVETPIERLYRVRQEYYLEIRKELKALDIRRNELVRSYTATVRDLDYDIDKQLRKMKEASKVKK
jgi:hypothetical protein